MRNTNQIGFEDVLSIAGFMACILHLLGAV